MSVAFTHITQRLMPLETVVSLPIPIVRQQRASSIHFAALVRNLPDRSNSRIYAPNFHVFVDWHSDEVIAQDEVAPLVPVEQSTPLGLYISDEFAGAPSAEKEIRYEYLQDTMYTAIENLGPGYFSKDAAALTYAPPFIQALQSLYSSLVVGLYRSLNPDFFSWLGGVSTPAPAARSRFCTNCGAQRGDGRFCTNCGTAFTD